MRNRNKYPENWVDTVRPTILKRDNYKCQMCGVKHRAYVLVDGAGNYTIIDRSEYEEYKPFGAKTYRIYLQVSHKNHDKNNCDSENLWSLCIRCHAKNDIAVKKLVRISDKRKKTCGCGNPECAIENMPHECFNKGQLIMF